MIQITSLGSKYFEGLRVAADWIQDLKKSNNCKHKEKVIERALISARLGSSTAQCFLYNCYLAYNPFFIYNIKNVPKTYNLTDRENPWVEFWSLLEELRTSYNINEKNFAEKIKNMSERFDSDEWNLLARSVILKNLKCGISGTILNHILNNTEWKIPVFGCQLPTEINSVNRLSGEKYLEPKINGYRTLSVVSNSSVILYGKNGKPFQDFHNIKETIFDCRDFCRHSFGKTITDFFGTRYVIDGVVVTKTSVHSTIAASSAGDVPLEEAVYYIFDIIPLSDFINGECRIKYSNRKKTLNQLSNVVRDRTSNIRVIDGIKVDLSFSEGHNILRRYAKMLSEHGFSEIVIKDLESPYLRGESNSWVVWKPSISNTLVKVT